MKKLTHLLKKYWFLALLASSFMVAEVYVDLYQPRMMQLIVDEGILGLSSNGVSNLNLVISTGIRMLLIVLLGGLCGIGSALFTNITGQSYGNDIRKACFEKVMRFSFEQTDDFSTGSLITRITNDVTQLQQLVMQLIRGQLRRHRRLRFPADPDRHRVRRLAHQSALHRFAGESGQAQRHHPGECGGHPRRQGFRAGKARKGAF